MSGFRGLAFSIVVGSLLCFGCSSGLEGDDPGDTTNLTEPAQSTNLRFGFDPCIALTDPITDVDLCGGVIPTTTGSRERPVAFVAFVTQTNIDDVDDATTDGNGASDVFVAAVDGDSVDPRAFVNSIAGTMRHTRCMTCHQMNIDVSQDPTALPPTPFLTQKHFPDGRGQVPLNDFSDTNCKDCHFDDWKAPGPTFDLRRAGTRELFIRAQTPPGGMTQHFRTDPRVLWALDSGATPFGGAADDDQDGIDEPEDHDGVRRHAPGGKRAFLARLDALEETADPVTGELLYSSAPSAVQDVVLASRAEPGGTQAGDGASRSPSMIYEPNPAFDPQNPTAAPAGFLHLAFESDAIDMVGGTLNDRSDVFKVTIDVMVTAADTIDLSYRMGSQVLISEGPDPNGAKGASSDPHIGANGDRVAFVSDAYDLVPGLTPQFCRPEVYLWDSGIGNSLVSHVPGAATPGDEGAINPSLSLDGMAVSFESDATDLVAGDTNGARDVFYALWPMLDVQRASLPDGGGQFTTHSFQGSIYHAGGEVKVAFASQENPLPPVVATQCPDEIVVLTANRDTHMREGRDSTNDTVNFGAVDLRVGTTGASVTNDGESRALIAFDVAGNVPAGATINAATLSLHVNIVPSGAGAGCPSAVDSIVSLHVLNADWAEGEATWQQRMTAVPWTAGGASGDFSLVESGSMLVQGIGDYEWTDPQMAADVQSWLDSGNNFGWLLRGRNADSMAISDDCTIKQIDSLSQASPATLVIDYSPPPPPLPASVGGGVCSVFLRDTALGRTLNLNEAVDPSGTTVAKETDIDGTPLPANATNPVISPDGNSVMFESMAQNLDVVRPDDLNRLMDVVLVDLLQYDAQGFVLPYKLSVTADGGNADGASHSPRLGVFTPPTDAYPLGLAMFATQARNLGDTEPADLDGDGMPDTDSYMLELLSEGASVIADFEADPARQGMGRNVDFASKSSGKPTSFLWDFGDGTPTSTKRSPRHVYTTPGLYTVKLTVSGDLGTDERTRIEYVHVLDAVMATFSTTKDASMAPVQGAANDVPYTTPVAGAIDDADPASRLLFDLSSDGSTEFPDDFSWTLTPVDAMGNPTGPAVLVSEEANPEGVPIDTTGLYDLTLEATGPGGAGMATQRVEVYQKVDASFTTNPMGTPVRGPAALMVQFTDTSSGDLLDMNAHQWDFGDGNVSTEANPVHTYAPGVYFASLTVSGKGTDADVSSVLPIISDGTITAAFTTMPRPAGSVSGLLLGEAIDDGSGVLVDFVNASQHQSGSPLFYRWTFGTGMPTGQETLQDPAGIQYMLSNPENVETFFINLVTSTTNPAPVNCLGQLPGTCDERTGSLTVYPRPAVDFMPPAMSFSSPANRPPHTVVLAGTVVGDGVGTSPSYRWLRSEANMPGATIEFATGLNVQFEFPDPGTYEVVLEVETNGPGGTRQTVQSPPHDVMISASTLTEWYMQAVDPASGARCTNCHKGANPPAGLNWLGTPPEIYERIVEDSGNNPVFSRNCNTSKRRIEPGDPDNSVVYNVLLKPPGPLCDINMRVNLPGDETEKDAHVAVLRSWIKSGAPNN